MNLASAEISQIRTYWFQQIKHRISLIKTPHLVLKKYIINLLKNFIFCATVVLRIPQTLKARIGASDQDRKIYKYKAISTFITVSKYSVCLEKYDY